MPISISSHLVTSSQAAFGPKDDKEIQVSTSRNDKIIVDRHLQFLKTDLNAPLKEARYKYEVFLFALSTHFYIYMNAIGALIPPTNRRYPERRINRGERPHNPTSYTD